MTFLKTSNKVISFKNKRKLFLGASSHLILNCDCNKYAECNFILKFLRREFSIVSHQNRDRVTYTHYNEPTHHESNNLPATNRGLPEYQLTYFEPFEIPYVQEIVRFGQSLGSFTFSHQDYQHLLKQIQNLDVSPQEIKSNLSNEACIDSCPIENIRQLKKLVKKVRRVMHKSEVKKWHRKFIRDSFEANFQVDENLPMSETNTFQTVLSVEGKKLKNWNIISLRKRLRSQIPLSDLQLYSLIYNEYIRRMRLKITEKDRVYIRQAVQDFMEGKLNGTEPKLVSAHQVLPATSKLTISPSNKPELSKESYKKLVHLIKMQLHLPTEIIALIMRNEIRKWERQHLDMKAENIFIQAFDENPNLNHEQILQILRRNHLQLSHYQLFYLQSKIRRQKIREQFRTQIRFLLRDARQIQSYDSIIHSIRQTINAPERIIKYLLSQELESDILASIPTQILKSFEKLLRTSSIEQALKVITQQLSASLPYALHIVTIIGKRLDLKFQKQLQNDVIRCCYTIIYDREKIPLQSNDSISFYKKQILSLILLPKKSIYRSLVLLQKKISRTILSESDRLYIVHFTNAQLAQGNFNIVNISNNILQDKPNLINNITYSIVKDTVTSFQRRQLPDELKSRIKERVEHILLSLDETTVKELCDQIGNEFAQYSISRRVIYQIVRSASLTVAMKMFTNEDREFIKKYVKENESLSRKEICDELQRKLKIPRKIIYDQVKQQMEN